MIITYCEKHDDKMMQIMVVFAFVKHMVINYKYCYIVKDGFNNIYRISLCFLVYIHMYITARDISRYMF